MDVRSIIESQESPDSITRRLTEEYSWTKVLDQVEQYALEHNSDQPDFQEKLDLLSGKDTLTSLVNWVQEFTDMRFFQFLNRLDVEPPEASAYGDMADQVATIDGYLEEVAQKLNDLYGGSLEVDDLKGFEDN